MSEALVGVTDRWTDGRREPGKSRGPRAAPRSLKDALSEAGLATDSDHNPTSEFEVRTRLSPHDVLRREPVSLKAALRLAEKPPSSPLPLDDQLVEDTPSQLRAQRLPVVEDVQPLISSSSRVEIARGGVVSPPPWVRAARRGRRHARFMNAFGWLVTIMVVGSIISVAGRYLVVPPGVESIYTARQ